MGTTRSLQQTSRQQNMSATDIKLFNKYTFDDVKVEDIALKDYIAGKPQNACFLPHSAGRWHKKRFKKAQCPIIERITNSLMMHGRNNGKKILAVRIMKHPVTSLPSPLVRTPSRSSLMLWSTLALVRTPAASALLVLCVVRPSMFLHFVV